MCKVSIIIPCYNDGKFLIEAIQSIQEYPIEADYEIIVVNDGSTDSETLSVIKKIHNLGIKVVSQENGGQSKARNAGIRVSKGKYILPVDADNKIRKEYISNGIKILDKYEDVGVVYGNIQLFGYIHKKKKTSKFNLTLNLRNNLLDNCAMYRRKIWEQVGGYDENMPYMGFEDWEFWINVAKRGWKFYKINKVLFDYRMREDSMLKTAKRDIPDYDNIVKDYMHIKHIRLLRVHYDLLCDYYYALSRLSIMFYLYTFYRKYVKPLIKKS